MSGGGTGWLILFLAVMPVAAQVTVPFVGCGTIGQVESAAPPNGSVKVPIDGRAASRLTSYNGVLAPRGWHCLNVIGSSGTRLSVRPSAFSDWDDTDGPSVIREFRNGWGSGSSFVTDRIARIFPAYRSIVIKVAESEERPLSNYPAGPFPTDKLTYRSSREVVFRTPAGADGLGTLTGLKKNADPIDGISMLVGESPDLFEVAIRLPAELRWLAPVIISASTYK